MHKAALLYTKGDGYFIGQLLRAELSPLFQNEILFLLERIYGYSDLSIWQTFSQKKNEVSLSLQGKQLTVFVANDKNWAFKLKSEFWKHVSATINLTASQYLKTGLAT